MLFVLVGTLFLWMGFGFFITNVVRRFELKEHTEELSFADGCMIPFLVGAGVGTLLQFIFSTMRVPLWFSLSAAIACSVFGWVQFGWKELRSCTKQSATSLRKNRWQLIGWIISSLFLVAFFIRSTSKTIYVWDGLAFWMPKMYSYWQDQGINPRTFIEFNHPEYPLLLPTIGADTFTLLGVANEPAAKAAIFSFSIAAVVLISSFIMRKLRWYIALPLLFSFLSLFIFREHVAGEYVGTADIFVGIYIMAGTVSMLQKKPLQAAVLWCLVPWAKSEGLVWAGVTTLGIVLVYPIVRKYVLLIASLLAAPWSIFTRLMGLSASQYFRFSELYARPWIEYAVYSVHSFREEFRNIQKWNLLFYLFFGALAFRIRQVFKDKALLISVVAFFTQIVSYMVIFTITPEEQATFIAAAISRLTLHLAPAAVCLTAYMISSTDKEVVYAAKNKKR